MRKYAILNFLIYIYLIIIILSFFKFISSNLIEILKNNFFFVCPNIIILAVKTAQSQISLILFQLILTKVTQWVQYYFNLINCSPLENLNNVPFKVTVHNNDKVFRMCTRKHNWSMRARRIGIFLTWLFARLFWHTHMARRGGISSC